MSQDLQAFYAQNAGKVENIKEVVSKRFKDAEGNPIPFEFKPITSEAEDDIKKRCIFKKQITQGKRKGQFDQDFDAIKYQKLFVIESIAFPNLKDAKLQESYGVMGEEDLYDLILKLPAEKADAYEAAQLVNGYEKDLSDLVEEVKN